MNIFTTRVYCCLIFVCTALFVTEVAPSVGLAQQDDQSRQEESLFVAQKAFDDGFYDVALNLLERFIRNYPSSPHLDDANLLMGQCYFHMSRFLMH